MGFYLLIPNLLTPLDLHLMKRIKIAIYGLVRDIIYLPADPVLECIPPCGPHHAVCIAQPLVQPLLSVPLDVDTAIYQLDPGTSPSLQTISFLWQQL